MSVIVAPSTATITASTPAIRIGNSQARLIRDQAVCSSVTQIFCEDPQIGQRAGVDEPFGHIGRPDQLLHIVILAHRDEPLAAPIVTIPEVLHDPKNPEHPAMRAQEGPPGLAQRAGIAGNQEFGDGRCRIAPGGHRIIDALARCRRDHPGGVAGDQHIAAIVPSRQRLERNRRAFAPDRLAAAEPFARAQPANRIAQGEALVRAADPDAGGVAVRKDPGVEIGRQRALVKDVRSPARRSNAVSLAAGERITS